MKQGSIILIIIFFIFIVFIIISGILLYKYKDLLFREDISELPTRDFYMNAVDVYTEKSIITNISIYCNHTFWNKVKLNGYGMEKIQMINCTGITDIVNEADNGYYTDFNIMMDNSFKNLIVKYYKIGEPLVNQQQSLSNSYDEIDLELSTDYQFRQVIICFTWSANILDVDIETLEGIDMRRLPDQQLFIDTMNKTFNIDEIVNQTNISHARVETWFRYDETFSYPLFSEWVLVKENLKTDLFPELYIEYIPQRLVNKVNKCYNAGMSLEKDIPQNVTVKYKKLNDLKESDFIRLYIIDRNKISTSTIPYKKFIFEDINGQDVGAKDYIFNLK